MRTKLPYHSLKKDNTIFNRNEKGSPTYIKMLYIKAIHQQYLDYSNFTFSIEH